MENKVQIIQKDDEQAVILVAEFPGMVHYVVPESVDFQAQAMSYLKEFLNQPVCIGFHLDLPAGVAQAAAEHINKDILQFLRYPEMKVDNTSILSQPKSARRCNIFHAVRVSSSQDSSKASFQADDPVLWPLKSE